LLGRRLGGSNPIGCMGTRPWRWFLGAWGVGTCRQERHRRRTRRMRRRNARQTCTPDQRRRRLIYSGFWDFARNRWPLRGSKHRAVNQPDRVLPPSRSRPGHPMGRNRGVCARCWYPKATSRRPHRQRFVDRSAQASNNLMRALASLGIRRMYSAVNRRALRLASSGRHPAGAARPAGIARHFRHLDVFFASPLSSQ
jgi:hypothetical protein